jgi:hypothetical protein
MSGSVGGVGQRGVADFGPGLTAAHCGRRARAHQRERSTSEFHTARVNRINLVAVTSALRPTPEMSQHLDNRRYGPNCDIAP